MLELLRTCTTDRIVVVSNYTQTLDLVAQASVMQQQPSLPVCTQHSHAAAACALARDAWRRRCRGNPAAGAAALL